MKYKQMDIFWKPPVRKKKVAYADFTIHEKINYKANECGLHDVLRGTWQYFIMDRTRAKRDMLSEDYWWHYKTNAGSEVRLHYYLLSKKTQLTAF